LPTTRTSSTRRPQRRRHLVRELQHQLGQEQRFDAFSATTDLDGTGSVSSQYYYTYNGTQKPLSYTYSNGVVDTSTNFYQECNLLAANVGTKFTKVIVFTLTASQKTNYANWYSYYRTRLLMMKTLTGQAFQPLTSVPGIGFSTLHDTGADESATFLPDR
jgi:type IV pilus assembly protein PilY1